MGSSNLYTNQTLHYLGRLCQNLPICDYHQHQLAREAGTCPEAASTRLCPCQRQITLHNPLARQEGPVTGGKSGSSTRAKREGGAFPENSRGLCIFKQGSRQGGQSGAGCSQGSDRTNSINRQPTNIARYQPQTSTIRPSSRSG